MFLWSEKETFKDFSVFSVLGIENESQLFLDKDCLQGVNFCKAILEEPWVCDGNGLKQDFEVNIINTGHFCAI